MSRLLRFLLFVPFLLIASVSVSAETHADMAFETDTLTVEAEDVRHVFRVELALTPAERERGLMFRESLAPDRGMLFLYPREQTLRMWMKNTLIPLDMLFIDAAGRVVAIHENAVPGSLAIISSGRPARGVLELAGGTVARLGLKIGAYVRHAAFAAP